MFNADIWLPVIKDIVSAAAPLAFILVLVRVGFNMITTAASGEGLFGRRY